MYKLSNWRNGLTAILALALLALVLPTSFAPDSALAQDATPTPEAEAADEAADAEADETEEAETEEAMEEDVQLVTATTHADLVRPGRVLMSARGNHWIWDSVPPINGPNEEVNPFDGMLGALIACSMYIYEAVAVENYIPLNHVSSTVTGEFDPRGVAGADVNPRVRAFHITMNVEGPTAEEAAMMAEAVATRCPIYTTLARSAPIEVTNIVYGQMQEPIATEADPIAEGAADGMEPELARPSTRGSMVETGRSLMSARGNHWIYDSVPPINGPNEEVNPLDAFIGALPSCGVMIYEAVAAEEGIDLNAVNATVEADLDPRGVAGADVDPRIREFRVTFNVDGPTMEQAEMMADAFRVRCPIYTTYSRSAPIEVTNVDMTAARSLDFAFGTHPQLGFPEQHVLVQQDGLDEGMGMRVDMESAADAANLERTIFMAGEDIGHDPFSLAADPLGPFPLGESLDMTLEDWLAAEGSGTYRIVGNQGEVSLSLQNLVPNGVYTLWCTRITVPPNFHMLNEACGPADGSENTFIADAEGNAEFSMALPALPDTDEETVSVFAVAYHSDGNTYGASPGTFGLNSHVQVFTMLPPFANEAWSVLDANAVMPLPRESLAADAEDQAEEAMDEAEAAGFAALFHGTAAPEHLDTLTKAQTLLAQESRQEPGTIRYDFYQQEDDPTQIMLLGIWESEADFEAHIPGDAHTSYAASLPEGAWATPPSMTRLLALDR